MTKIYSTAEVAAMMNISSSLIKKWIQNSRFPVQAPKMSNGFYYFDEQLIEQIKVWRSTARKGVGRPRKVVAMA